MGRRVISLYIVEIYVLFIVTITHFASIQTCKVGNQGRL